MSKSTKSLDFTHLSLADSRGSSASAETVSSTTSHSSQQSNNHLHKEKTSPQSRQGLSNDRPPSSQVRSKSFDDAEMSTSRAWDEESDSASVKGSVPGALNKRHSHSHETHVNHYTECGRHGDDWLFGGFSLVETFKKIWERKQ